MAALNQNDTIATGSPTGVVTLNAGDTIGNNVQYYNSGGTTYTNSQYQAPGTAPITPQPSPTTTLNTTPVTSPDTSQPNPATTNATPYTGDPEMAPSFLYSQPQSLTQQGLAAAQASGQTPPQDAATAATAVKQFTPPTPNTSYQDNISAQLAQDPGYQKILDDSKTLNDVSTQGKSLLDTYKQMETDAGIPGIDTQLLNTQKIINGTEDDIRNEVTAAGGFATDSQVLALSTARNKSLVQNYNNLLATKTNAENHINTMMSLTSTDRQNAIAVANQRLNVDEQLANYRNQFIANATEGYNSVLKAVGYSGLVNSLLNTDPTGKSLTTAEQMLGLQPGQLQNLATQEKSAQNLATIQAAGAKTAYVVTPQGEVWNSATGYAYTSPEDFQAKTGISLDQANAKQLISPITSTDTVAQQQAQLNLEKTQAEINNINNEIVNRNASNPTNPTNLANTPGYDSTGVKYTTGTASQEILTEWKNGFLQGNGTISSTDYNSAKQWWIQQGLTASSFDSEFGAYIDKSNTNTSSSGYWKNTYNLG